MAKKQAPAADKTVSPAAASVQFPPLSQKIDLACRTLLDDQILLIDVCTA